MTAQTAPLSLWLILCCPLSQKCCHLEAADEADALLEQLADYSPSSPKKMGTQLGTRRARAFVFRSRLMETRTAIGLFQGDPLAYSSERLSMAVVKYFEAREECCTKTRQGSQEGSQTCLSPRTEAFAVTVSGPAFQAAETTLRQS